MQVILVGLQKIPKLMRFDYGFSTFNLTIVDPTTAVPESVSTGDNITVKFNFLQDGSKHNFRINPRGYFYWRIYCNNIDSANLYGNIRLFSLFK